MRDRHILVGQMLMVCVQFHALAAQQAPPSVAAAIQAVEDNWAKAYISKDARLLETILTAEFTITEEGKQASRKEVLDREVAVAG